MSTMEDLLRDPEPGVGHLWVEMLSPESAAALRSLPWRACYAAGAEYPTVVLAAFGTELEALGCLLRARVPVVA